MQHGLIRLLHMQRVAVGFRVDRDEPTPIAAESNDAACDCAAIGDQDFVEHHSAESQIMTRIGVGL